MTQMQLNQQVALNLDGYLAVAVQAKGGGNQVAVMGVLPALSKHEAIIKNKATITIVALLVDMSF